jgi:hypothetical protein
VTDDVRARRLSLPSPLFPAANVAAVVPGLRRQHSNHCRQSAAITVLAAATAAAATTVTATTVTTVTCAAATAAACAAAAPHVPPPLPL